MAYSIPSGLRLFAKNVIDSLEAGQIVVCQFPHDELGAQWLPLFLGACDDEFILRGESFSLHLEDAAESGVGPQELLEEMGADSISDFLSGFGVDPVAIRVPTGATSEKSWRRFADDLISLRKSSPPGHHLRHIVLLWHGEVPLTVRDEASVRHYQAWNPLRWEEARLLIGEKLGWDTSEISRSWMIASYAGASCLDLALIDTLCQERPASISQIVDLVCHKASTMKSAPEGRSIIELGEFDRRWQVPEELGNAWDDGIVVGATLERGIQQPLQCVPHQHRRTTVLKHVWQEQVAGLLPLVIEINHQANRLLDRSISTNWRSVFAKERRINSLDETYYCEPGPLLYYLRRSKDFFLSANHDNLFERLVKVRNKLAHMEPVEVTELQSLWDLYVRVRNLRRDSDVSSRR